jgi:FixJ family two-component response regulator
VENHRAWVMERTGAKNLAELVRIALQIQARS